MHFTLLCIPMIDDGYVGEVERTKIQHKISVASLSINKMDHAFDHLEEALVEVVSITQDSRKHIFGSQGSKANDYSFTTLARNGGRSHLTLR